MANRSINLTKIESNLYEDKGPKGDAFRKKIRKQAAALSLATADEDDRPSPVDIYSFDGITFDQVVGEMD